MGHLNLGKRFGFTSWAIPMSLLILFSNMYGRLFREWQGASLKSRLVVYTGMVTIIVVTLIITVGNYLGDVG